MAPANPLSSSDDFSDEESGSDVESPNTVDSPQENLAALATPSRPLKVWPTDHLITTNKYATSTDSRGFIPVYEYTLNNQTLMMDSDNGMILITAIWKCLGHGKADVVRLIESQPAIAGMIRKVRGGYLKIQGTWLPFELARELAKRVAWELRDDLVPFFGPDFPASCIAPGQPGFGQLVLSAPKVRCRRSTKDPSARAAAQAASLAALNNSAVLASDQVAASKHILSQLGDEPPQPSKPSPRKCSSSGPVRRQNKGLTRSASLGTTTSFAPYTIPAPNYSSRPCTTPSYSAPATYSSSAYSASYTAPRQSAYPPPPASASQHRYSSLFAAPSYRLSAREPALATSSTTLDTGRASEYSYPSTGYARQLDDARQGGYSSWSHSAFRPTLDTPSTLHTYFSESSMRGSTRLEDVTVPEQAPPQASTIEHLGESKGTAPTLPLSVTRPFFHLEQSSIPGEEADCSMTVDAAAMDACQLPPASSQPPTPPKRTADTTPQQASYYWHGPSGRARISLLDAAAWAERGIVTSQSG